MIPSNFYSQAGGDECSGSTYSLTAFVIDSSNNNQTLGHSSYSGFKVQTPQSTTSCQTLFLTYPAGGETLTVGDTMHITWSSSNIPSDADVTVNIFDTRFCNGPSYKCEQPIAITKNTGSYDWPIPQTFYGLSGGDLGGVSAYRIQIDYNLPLGGTLVANDNIPFTIIAGTSLNIVTCSNPNISISSPKGGEIFTVGDTMHITWDSCGINPLSSLYIAIMDSRFNTETGEGEAAVVTQLSSTDSYDWVIPASLSNFSQGKIGGTSVYSIYIGSQDGSVTTAQTPVFSINTLPTITVTSPNGGETFKTGDTVHITWTSIGIDPTISLGLGLVADPMMGDGGLMIGMVPNTGSYDWVVPASLSGFTLDNDHVYKILVRNDGPTASDESDNTFTINPPVISTVVSTSTIIPASIDTSSHHVVATPMQMSPIVPAPVVNVAPVISPAPVVPQKQPTTPVVVAKVNPVVAVVVPTKIHTVAKSLKVAIAGDSQTVPKSSFIEKTKNQLMALAISGHVFSNFTVWFVFWILILILIIRYTYRKIKEKQNAKKEIK